MIKSFINQIIELKNDINKYPEILWGVAIVLWGSVFSGISEQLYLREILEINQINLVIIPLAILVFYLITNSAIKMKKKLEREEIYKQFKKKVLK